MVLGLLLGPSRRDRARDHRRAGAGGGCPPSHPWPGAAEAPVARAWLVSPSTSTSTSRAPWPDALHRRGIDVLMTSEAELLGESDADHLNSALATGRVLVTQDSDFLRLHEQGHPHAGIAFCAQGSRTIGQIVVGLVLIHELLTAEEMIG